MNKPCSTEGCKAWTESGQCASCKEFGEPGTIWRDILTEIEERMGFGNPSSNLANAIRRVIIEHARMARKPKRKFDPDRLAKEAREWDEGIQTPKGWVDAPECVPKPRKIDPEDLRKPMDF
jgi:hypothetical protein